LSPRTITSFSQSFRTDDRRRGARGLYPEKGVCAKDKGGHAAAGYNFFLYHDRSPSLDEEDGWRYCGNCHALFTTKFPGAVGCPATGKGHVAAGYKFVVGRKGAAGTL
jgi:hypothetical protein